VNQQGFRQNLTQVILDELDTLGFDELSDCVYGQWRQDDIAIDKAMSEAYTSLQVALRKLSRLGARLDYLEKEKK
jgi:hypothetical protein